MGKRMKIVQEDEYRNELKRKCLTFNRLKEKENAFKKTIDVTVLEIEAERDE